MALRNVPLLLQTGGYCLSLVLSLCIVVPMSLHQDEFGGNCVLFSKQYYWYHGTLYVLWASEFYCHYVLFVGVAAMITSLVQIYRLLMLWVERRDTSFLSMFLEAVMCMVLSVLAVSAGVIVTAGFMTWCQSISEQFPRCEDVAGENIDGVSGSTEWVYVQIDTAQFGVWAIFATLVGLGVGSTLKLLHHHQVRNLHAVMSCEADEHRPLLNSGWSEEGHPTATPIVTYT